MTTEPATTKILVVEDDTAIALGICDNLELEGYLVRHCAEGSAGLEAAVDWRPTLVLLDVMLPGMNGYEILKEMRRRELVVPVIMVTAKGEEFDRCLGLDLGADDYLVKPFSLKELLARVRAQLRRANLFQAETPLCFGEVEVDFARSRLTVAGVSQHVTSTELALLRYFAQRPARVLNRQQILDGVWGHDYFGTERTVDNFIRQLRLKIEPQADSPRYLKTVRGQGYLFDIES